LFTGDTLSTVLYAVATGYPDRARSIVHESDELEPSERERLHPVLESEGTSPAEQARLLGDALRELQANRDLSNECYRLAFYLDQGSVGLSDNPLYAYFAAHRSGRLLDKWVHYFPIYHRHLGQFRDRGARLLEIGVSHGGSLELWRHYFGQRTALVGIDIDEAAVRHAGPAATVLIGDQTDRDFLTAVVEEHGPFDVVIDDGGHHMHQQIASVETLFPSLSEGGVYLVEDCHTSYWDEFGGGVKRDGTFIEWVKDRIDDLHRYHLSDPVDAVWATHVDSVHCYDSVVVLEKRARRPPFAEQAGTSTFVYQNRPVSALVGEMLATRDAAIAQRRASEDALAATRSELRASDDALAATKSELLDAWSQIKDLRGTLSWRTTAPFRRLRRYVKRR
jgi:SAM-dependent methyltransferase